MKITRYKNKLLSIGGLLVLTFLNMQSNAQKVPYGTINRKLVVQRHNIVFNSPEFAGPTQVGNAHISYSMDITGFQTFNSTYTTMADWGWHSFPEPKGSRAASFIKPLVNTQGRKIPYDCRNGWKGIHINSI
jgi:hypothetical protein